MSGTKYAKGLYVDRPPQPKLYFAVEDGTVHTTASYPYKKLQESNYLRILKLLPRSYVHASPQHASSAKSGVLHVEIAEYALSSAPQYECLSYVWGELHEQAYIWLDTIYVLPITHNLNQALRCLQHETEPRYLWVDYICINQKDLEERKHQVELMYDIYRSAQNVVIYLGEEADGSELVPDLMNRIVDADHAHRDEPNKPWLKEDFLALGLPPPSSQAWLALAKFLARPWFRRAWVIQEVLAARAMSIICGRWLDRGILTFRGIFWAILHNLPMPAELHDSWPYMSSDASYGLRQLSFIMRSYFTPFVLDEQLVVTLFDILESTQRASASDPRDKVYAFLNFCPLARRLGIVPDYTLNVVEIYKLVARRTITTGQGHRVLLNSSGSRTTLDLPSWVPDWSIDRFSPFSVVGPQFEYVTSSAKQVKPTYESIYLSHSPDELFTIGIKVGRLTHLEPLCEDKSDPNAQTLSTETTKPRTAGPDSKISNNANRNSISSASGTTNTGNDQDFDQPDYPQRFRLYTTAFRSIAQSPRYKNKNTTEITWRSLLCSHARGVHNADHADFKNFNHLAPAYYQFNRATYDPSFRSTFDKNVAAHIKASDPRYATDVMMPEDAAKYTMRLSKYLQSLRKLAEAFDQALTRFCYTLRLAVTDNKYVGMVPADTQIGDIFVCIKGMEAPLIIRKVEDQNKYRVVGTAYFHGFMAGEKRLEKLFDSRTTEEIILV